LRAFVHKKDGSTRFQVYIDTFETGSRWPRFRTVNYFIPDRDLASAELDQLGSDVSCSTYFECTYKETIAFEISEDEIRKLAEAYRPGGRVEMQMRIKGQSGVSRDLYLTASEAAGLLQVVDAYRIKMRENSVSQDASGHPQQL